jgi:multisubunit Na+/H+ antiporter MnhB subunit
VEEAALALSVFDAVLGLTLVGFAAVLLNTGDRFEAIVLFIVFGLLMALTWGRLDAVDIAIAEAAIGAGLTGAMLLNAHSHLQSPRGGTAGRVAEGEGSDHRSGRARAALIPLALAVGAVPAWALHTASGDAGLREPVLRHLAESGVENPVTAVLMSFRAYDTLLEMAILLCGATAVWALRLPLSLPPRTGPGPVLQTAVRVLVPITVLVAGYLLWLGAHAPGGAFQAGAVLAGAGVLWLLAESRLPRRGGRLALRLGLSAGVLLFAAVGLTTVALGEPFLTYRGERAHALILTIEIAATLAIGLALVALFSGHSPDADRRESP